MGAPKTICHSSTPLVLAQFMLSILIISLGTEALSTKTSLQRKHAIIPKVSTFRASRKPYKKIHEDLEC